MRVSIVLPTYNGSRYLAESVRSCVDQTFADWELIIVDDCSTDSTPSIIADFAAADSRIRSIRNAENKRLPASLNIGFEAARGSLLTWTSDDNRYRPDALREMVAFLDARPEVGMVYADYDVIDGDGVNLGSGWLGGIGEMGYRNVIGACFLYRRCVADAIGGYAEDLFLAEDYDYWLRIMCQFPIARLRKRLYDYRLHAGALTSTKVEGVRRTTSAALARNLGALERAVPHTAALAHLHLARHAREEGDAALMRSHLVAAFRLAPSTPFRWHQSILVECLLGPRVAAALRKRARRNPTA
jgi:glycosyltransferase involved in cell wall biosynthesis